MGGAGPVFKKGQAAFFFGFVLVGSVLRVWSKSAVSAAVRCKFSLLRARLSSWVSPHVAKGAAVQIYNAHFKPQATGVDNDRVVQWATLFRFVAQKRRAVLAAP